MFCIGHSYQYQNVCHCPAVAQELLQIIVLWYSEKNQFLHSTLILVVRVFLVHCKKAALNLLANIFFKKRTDKGNWIFSLTSDYTLSQTGIGGDFTVGFVIEKHF